MSFGCIFKRNNEQSMNAAFITEYIGFELKEYKRRYSFFIFFFFAGFIYALKTFFFTFSWKRSWMRVVMRSFGILNNVCTTKCTFSGRDSRCLRAQCLCQIRRVASNPTAIRKIKFPPRAQAGERDGVCLQFPTTQSICLEFSPSLARTSGVLVNATGTSGARTPWHGFSLLELIKTFI